MSAGGRFKLLQFNMQYGQGWDDAYPDHAPIDLQSTIDEIRTHDADIIMLQEVEQTLPGGVQANPPPHYTRLMAEFKDYDSYFSYPKPDPRELPFGIGLAIFSRTALRDRQRRDIPSPPVEFDFHGEKRTPTDRLLISATTTLAKHEVRVFNTHLLAFFMLKSSSEEYIHQRELVLEALRAAGGTMLLAGDFNVSNHESLVRQFASAGYRSAQTEEVTWRRRPYVLDHIFFSRQLRLESHQVKPKPASDHHALVADFAFAE
jgi:endonuclease/exonuclease/phosphatase family metal-dependent hydrolase